MADLETAYTQGPKTWNEAFPPICIRTHWDPTALASRVLPGVAQRNLAMDPRPATMICKQYYTTSAGDSPLVTNPDKEQLQHPQELLGGMLNTQMGIAQQIPFPPGGAAGRGFPYESYNPAAESDILRLREQLSKCAEKRYVPHDGIPSPDMSMNDVPGADQHPNIAANIVKTSTNCRAEDDEAAWNKSSRLFSNPTRYDRMSGEARK